MCKKKHYIRKELNLKCEIIALIVTWKVEFYYSLENPKWKWPDWLYSEFLITVVKKRKDNSN
jgi:hypothetical protein